MANAVSLSPAGDHTAILSPQFLSCSPLGGGVTEGGEGAREVRQMVGGLPAAGAGGSPAFTASQYEELQVQALIYKHLIMGAPVPQELLLSVRRSLESMATRLYNPHPFGYYSYFGKKFDPEPGRCRRTDGKKWRCSKDAYPDSKYCERHMHRGRNRSRKPVESPPLSQAQPPAAAGSIVAESLAPSMNGASGSLSLQSIHMHSLANAQVPFSAAQIESSSCGSSSKEFRYQYEVKPEVGQHSFFSEPSGSAKGLGMDSTLDNPWSVMPSQMSLFPLSKMANGSALGNGYPQLSPLDNLGQVSMNSLSKQDQVPHSFFGSSELGAVESVKQGQSLHPFIDDWPKTRASWPDLSGGRSNLSSYSTTELSISIPMASSDFSTSSSRTPNGTSS